MTKTAPLIEERLAKVLAEREVVYAHWGRLHADWLRARADCVTYYRKEEDANQKYQERTDRLDETTRALMLEPASFPFMVWDKIAVLEHFLHGDGEPCNWVDNRQVWLLACIKADMMRLGPGMSQ